MKPREKRIQLLERTLLPEPETNYRFTWEEYLAAYKFVSNFEKMWPDDQTAPKFALAEYHRLHRRLYRTGESE